MSGARTQTIHVPHFPVASTSGARINSYHATYTSANNGANLSVGNPTYWSVKDEYIPAGPYYQIAECFFSFDITLIPAGAVIYAASLDVYAREYDTSGGTWQLEFLHSQPRIPLTTSDWRSASDLTTLKDADRTIGALSYSGITTSAWNAVPLTGTNLLDWLKTRHAAGLSIFELLAAMNKTRVASPASGIRSFTFGQAYADQSLRLNVSYYLPQANRAMQLGVSM